MIWKTNEIMEAKIDLDKFVRSLMERYYEKIHIDPTTTRCWLDRVLKDQGLEYKDGEIVEIEQEQPYNKPLFFEQGKWYTCIAKVDGFKVGHNYQSKMNGTVSNDSGAMYMYHNDVNLIFRPATEEEIKKGGELRKWLDFGKTQEGTTITIPKDLKGTDTDGGVVGPQGEQGEQPTEEEMVGMGELSEMWSEQAIISRLDKIIELLQSAILSISRSPYVTPIIYKNPLDPDPNELGGWKVTANAFGSDYDIDTDKIKQDETNKSKS